jgi:hypothetical protein
LSVRPTPKALRLIADERYDREPCGIAMTKFEIVKLVYPLYIPALIMGGLTVAGVIYLNSIHTRRNSALAAAYSLSEVVLKEYQDKLLETLGEKKAQKFKDEIYKDRIDKNPLSKNAIIFTGKGDTLCYDSYSGRYFKSDIEIIRQKRNDLNEILLKDGFISLNDLYYELGLENIKMGTELGWNINDGQIDFTFSSQLAEGGVPCLTIDYSVGPKFNYD